MNDVVPAVSCCFFVVVVSIMMGLVEVLIVVVTVPSAHDISVFVV